MCAPKSLHTVTADMKLKGACSFEESYDRLVEHVTKNKDNKGNQSWVLIGRTDVEAETPILWPPDARSPGKCRCIG